jgi:hypothetical protein
MCTLAAVTRSTRLGWDDREWVSIREEPREATFTADAAFV